jgi:thioredoxin reductase
MIIASGCRRMKLVYLKREFEKKGVFNCTLCNGDQFLEKKVTTCDGGDRDLTKAFLHY